jgi:phosphoglycerol transferase MdoB-like AlkP superfamily enzyme
LEKIIHQVFIKICDVATNPKLAPTHFIIVGDHAPPFISVEKRQLFSRDRVPSIIMIPKKIIE